LARRPARAGYHQEQDRLKAEERELDSRRRALHEQRLHEEEKGLLRPLSEHGGPKRLGLRDVPAGL
jgi:hypothetical protein